MNPDKKAQELIKRYGKVIISLSSKNVSFWTEVKEIIIKEKKNR